MRLRITALAIILIVLSACGGVSAAQGFIQQHTRCPAIYYSSPRWSPDGSRIAFTMSDFLPFKTVYLDMIDVNTFTYKRLTSVYDGVYTPTWSPDGSYLAVSAVRGTDIYVIDATTLDESRIMMGVTTHYMNPDWSPDGKRLILTTDRDGSPTLITATLTDDLIRDGFEESDSYPVIEVLSNKRGPIQGQNPRWSPDGSQIAYIDSRPSVRTIYIIKSDGTDEIAILSDPYMGSTFAWSPDSKQIAYSSGAQGSESIYLMNTDGTNSSRLAYGVEPDWSRDGKRIAFIGRDANGYDEIFIMNVDGSNKIQLTQNPANGICIH